MNQTVNPNQNNPNQAQVNPEDKPGILKFAPPETPEEFYRKGQSYLTGARCAVPFQERAAYLSKAAEMFRGAGDYLDASALSREYARMAQVTLESGFHNAYEAACRLRRNAVHEDDFFKAARAFERISGYRDADEQAEACEKKLRAIRARRLPTTLGIIAAVIVLIAALVVGAQTDAFRYQLARGASAVGLDSVGSTLFTAAHGYADSDARLEKCNYREGKRALKRNDYANAVSRFARMTADVEDSAELKFGAEQTLLSTASVGTEVSFGRSKWIILGRDAAGRLLLLASHPLSAEEQTFCFDALSDAAGYPNSDLCAYLNGEYADAQFSELEKAALDWGDGMTVDLLSCSEYETFMDLITDVDHMSKTDWWLSDVGSVEGTAACVAWDGTLNPSGCAMDSTVVRVRPLLRVAVE